MSASYTTFLHTGETVAAKEIDLVTSQLKQDAFITEALRLQQLRWAAPFWPACLGAVQWVGLGD